MDTNKPQAKGDDTCPFHKQPMSKVCHKCALFVKVRGTTPDGQEIDNWNCSFAFLPYFVLEGAAMTRQLGAAVESMRNEMVKMDQAKLNMAAPYLTEAADRLKQINRVP